MSNTLSMWAIYDCPSDFPDKIVVRRWETKSGMKPKMTKLSEREYQVEETVTPIAREARTFDSLQQARNYICRFAPLRRVPRMESDDSQLIEIWL